MTSRSFSFCCLLKRGTVIMILYGRGLLPSTLALITFVEIFVSSTEPLPAYARPLGKRLSKSIFEREFSHCWPHQVWPYFTRGPDCCVFFLVSSHEGNTSRCNTLSVNDQCSVIKMIEQTAKVCILTECTIMSRVQSR